MVEGKKLWGSPGTGKTTNLIQMMYQEVDNQDFSRVAFCTYRSQMANEFKKRLGLEKNEAMYFSTIHGLCYRLIGREEGVVADDGCIRDFCVRNNLQPPSPKGVLEDGLIREVNSEFEQYMDARTWLTNMCLSPKDLGLYQSKKPISTPDYLFFDELWSKYKSEKGLLDYNDMLLRALKYDLTPSVEYLFVDEYQDISPIQHRLIRMWGDNIGKVFIAGDINQSIYGYLGANPRFFQDEALDELELGHSFRLTNEILSFSKRILTYGGLPIPQVTANKPGGAIKVTPLENLHNHIHPSKTTMILCRANYLCFEVQKYLTQHGIVFRGMGGGWTPQMVDVYNSLVFLKGGLNQISAESWVNFLLRLSSKYTMFKKNLLTEKRSSVFGLPDGVFNLTREQALKTIHPFWSNNLVEAKEYREFFTPSTTSDSVLGKIEGYLARNRKPITHLNVEVSTIHASKGSEADEVFLLNSITPSVEACLWETEKFKEEARVFYVGATRARQKLTIVDCFELGHTYPLIDLKQ